MILVASRRMDKGPVSLLERYICVASRLMKAVLVSNNVRTISCVTNFV